MTKTEALIRLRAPEPRLRALGIARLSTFGSTARCEEREDSDIDLTAELCSDLRMGAFQSIRMENRVAELLGRRVDLITEPGSEAPRLQAEIDRDRVRVF